MQVQGVHPKMLEDIAMGNENISSVWQQPLQGVHLKMQIHFVHPKMLHQPVKHNPLQADHPVCDAQVSATLGHWLCCSLVYY